LLTGQRAPFSPEEPESWSPYEGKGLPPRATGCRDAPSQLFALRFAAVSDILSGMKTFTVRDLDRQPAKVLKVCDQEGAVNIRRRDGRSYRLLAEAAPGRMRLPSDFVRQRLRRTARLFPEPISAAQVQLVDKLIAGE
jgi:hypothetical protein